MDVVPGLLHLGPRAAPAPQRVCPAGNSLYHATKWGIKGFCEAVAQEVAPFGTGVTIAEPGGARTKFRYGRARVADPMPEYDGNPSTRLPAHGRPCQRARSPATRPAWPPTSSTVSTPNPPRCARVLGSQALESTIDTLHKRIAAFERRSNWLPPATRPTSDDLTCQANSSRL